MMKKLIFTIAAIFIITISDGYGQTKNSNNNKTTLKKEKVMTTIQLTKDEFLKKVMNYEENDKVWKYLGNKPAIVDFYADWCGPCKAVAPILEKLAGEYKDEIYVYKVNTENEQELAAAFGIRSIPSILFIPMKGDPHMIQGALPESSLKKTIEDVLLKKDE